MQSCLCRACRAVCAEQFVQSSLCRAVCAGQFVQSSLCRAVCAERAGLAVRAGLFAQLSRHNTKTQHANIQIYTFIKCGQRDNFVAVATPQKYNYLVIKNIDLAIVATELQQPLRAALSITGHPSSYLELYLSYITCYSGLYLSSIACCSGTDQLRSQYLNCSVNLFQKTISLPRSAGATATE